MRMKIPNCYVSNSYYACGDRETYDSDPEDYPTPPNEESSEHVEDFSEYLWMENEEEFDKLVRNIFIFLSINLFIICFNN